MSTPTDTDIAHAVRLIADQIAQVEVHLHHLAHLLELRSEE